MSLFKKKKDKKPSRAMRYFTVCLWRLFKKLQVRDRVIAANIWADSHRRETAFITIGVLSLSLLIGVITTLVGTDKGNDENFMNGIEDVQNMFQGFQQIQASKDYQKEQISALLLKGKVLKNELDSLLLIKDKTHEDTVQIAVKYKQLEIITRNLKTE